MVDSRDKYIHSHHTSCDVALESKSHYYSGKRGLTSSRGNNVWAILLITQSSLRLPRYLFSVVCSGPPAPAPVAA